MSKEMCPNPKVSLVSPKRHRHHFNSFFAGIGGFDLGFQQAGIAPAFHCEINSFCHSVLARHWPDTPLQADIRSIDASGLPKAEIWCGGFPCQDVSLATSWRGRKGLKGENSGLFFPFYDLICKEKPKVVILENVVGLLNSHKGQDFKAIVNALTDAGYGVAWRVLNTRYFGSPQSRPRVFISACLGNLDLAIANLYEMEMPAKPKNARQGFLTASTCAVTEAIVPEVAYCLAATSGRHTGTDWSRSYVSYYDRVRRLTPSECERLQGFPTGWSLPSSNFHMSDDAIDTHRYHALGNAVSVAVVNWIGRRIVKNLDSAELPPTKGRFSSNRLRKIAEKRSKAFSDSAARIQTLSEITDEVSIKWKSGGCAFKDFVIDLAVSPAPKKPVESRFIDVIESREVDKKYFLSPNAAEGILRRVNGQGRTLFGPLNDALCRLARTKSGAIDEVDSESRQQISIFG